MNFSKRLTWSLTSITLTLSTSATIKKSFLPNSWKLQISKVSLQNEWERGQCSNDWLSKNQYKSNYSDQSQKEPKAPLTNQNFYQLFCNLLKAREKLRVQGVIGFRFASHWLKSWREIFAPIIKCSNAGNRVLLSTVICEGSRIWVNYFSQLTRCKCTSFSLFPLAKELHVHKYGKKSVFIITNPAISVMTTVNTQCLTNKTV